MCITLFSVDCSHLIILSFCQVSFFTHQQGWEANTQAHTHAHTETHFQIHTSTNTSNSNQQSNTHTPFEGQTHTAFPRKGRRTPWCGQTHNCTHSHPESSTQPDTPAHQPSPLPPAHAQWFGSSVPTLIVMLRLKLCSRCKCKSCTR